MLNQNPSVRRLRMGPLFMVVFLAVLVLVSTALFGQTTVSTGSIVGTVTDPSGALVDNAKVTVTNTETNQIINLTSNASGAYNSGALSPGNYKVQVSAERLQYRQSGRYGSGRKHGDRQFQAASGSREHRRGSARRTTFGRQY